MIVKRYSGRTAEEALAQAKWELGDDAVILSSGMSRDRWWKFWEHGFQVLVATDYPVTKRSGEPMPDVEKSPDNLADRVIPMNRGRRAVEDDGLDPHPVLDRIEIREPSRTGTGASPEPE
ncbi:MAG: hypothetical protein M1415_03000, partial [Firmicutes bacterium]|nr:hypothetical protein [Bacillota bacterium]